MNLQIFQPRLNQMFAVSNLYGIGPTSHRNNSEILTQVSSRPVVVKRSNSNNMKYHTLSTSSIAAEGKKSSFTIYADIMDLKHDKVRSQLLLAH